MEFRPRLIKKGEPTKPVRKPTKPLVEPVKTQPSPTNPSNTVVFNGNTKPPRKNQIAPLPKPLPATEAETQQLTPPPPKHVAELVRKLKSFFKGYLKSGKKFDAESKKRAMKQFGITSKELKAAIRHMAGHPPDREVCFQIEQGFFGRAESWPGGFSELAALTAKELEVREAVCYTWLTWLARLKGSFRHQIVADESAEKILARYRDYLTGEAPPAEPVHAWIARQLEEPPTPEQVGFVLITHRRKILTEFKRRAAANTDKPPSRD